MAIKLIFAVDVPIKGQRYVIDGEHTGEWVPCTRRKDLFFSLCEICGSQIIDRRRTKTCSNRCTEKYWKRVRETERSQSCRPFFWNTFRAETLERDGNKCTQCGSSRSLEVHHIVPIHAGGTNSRENLTTLCHKCHVAIHANERKPLVEKQRRVAILEKHGGKTIEEWCELKRMET
jgi:5-methylcytosine-specific restriction endonuclease McrA